MKTYLLVLAPLMTVSLALAQNAQESGRAATAGEHATTSDAAFMKKLAEGDLAEVDAGRLASQKGSNPSVKAFGEQMVKDHSKNSTELETLAKGHGIQVPTTIDHEHDAAKAKLDAASDTQFDSEYVKAQVRDHEKTVQLLESEIHGGQEKALQDFAQKTLPVVQHHLAMAKQLEEKLPKSAAERSSQ